MPVQNAEHSETALVGGRDAHCVRDLFRRKMRGFRRKPTEENSQERISGQELVIVLGELPLAIEIREQADGGMPTVAADPDGEVAATYRDIARHLAARLWALDACAPQITMDDN